MEEYEEKHVRLCRFYIKDWFQSYAALERTLCSRASSARIDGELFEIRQ